MRPLAIIAVLMLTGAPPAVLGSREGPLSVQSAPPVMPVAGVTTKHRPAPGSSWLPPLLEDAVSTPVGLGITITVATICAAFALFLLRLISLKAMAVVADARLALAEKRSQLAAIAPTAVGGTTGLSATEIENLLAAGFPEIDPELAASLARALAAAIKDKSTR